MALTAERISRILGKREDSGKLRRFDLDLLDKGFPLAARVYEHVPFCWFCNSTSGKQTDEHIFPRWLLEHRGDRAMKFTPARIRESLDGGDAAVANKRGPLSASALVCGEVCAVCNNGWMSQLEADNQETFKNWKSGELDKKAALDLARWFVKTAIVLNVSQPYRLMWNQERRHDVRTGMPKDVIVNLYRVPSDDLNWCQGMAMQLIMPDDFVDDAQRVGGITRQLLDLTYTCNIQVGELVGSVLMLPHEWANQDLESRGHPLFDGGLVHTPAMEVLPVYDYVVEHGLYLLKLRRTWQYMPECDENVLMNMDVARGLYDAGY